MFKIRDAAKLLNVETVEIHKKLISLKQDLKPYVRKDRGITYISDEGIQIIARSFLKKDELSYHQQNTENQAYKREKLNSKSGKSTVKPEPVTDVKPETVCEEPSQEEVQPKSDIIYKDSRETKTHHELNNLKTEINRLDTEIYKTHQMILDYLRQLEKKNSELSKLLRVRGK